MKLQFVVVLAAGIAGLPVAALADFDGSRQPAGGAHMSTSAAASAEGEQIFTQPTMAEKASVQSRRPNIQPVWTSAR